MYRDLFDLEDILDPDDLVPEHTRLLNVSSRPQELRVFLNN